jgi:hypothetical protein
MGPVEFAGTARMLWQTGEQQRQLSKPLIKDGGGGGSRTNHYIDNT